MNEFEASLQEKLFKSIRQISQSCMKRKETHKRKCPSFHSSNNKCIDTFNSRYLKFQEFLKGKSVHSLNESFFHSKNQNNSYISQNSKRKINDLTKVNVIYEGKYANSSLKISNCKLLLNPRIKFIPRNIKNFKENYYSKRPKFSQGAIQIEYFSLRRGMKNLLQVKKVNTVRKPSRINISRPKSNSQNENINEFSFPKNLINIIIPHLSMKN